MKRTAVILTAALLLTACTAERKDGEFTETSVTTPLTLTESITTEIVPEPPAERKPVKIAMFSLFGDGTKCDEAVLAELTEAVERVSDGRAFLYASPSMFWHKSQYAISYVDYDVTLERNDEDEYSYSKLNPEIAETEEELIEYFRSIFTEECFSDEELRKELFEPINENAHAAYKTIDGVLCMKQQYLGVSPSINFDEILYSECEGDRALVVTLGTGVADPPYHCYIELEKSGEYGWRASSVELKEYDESKSKKLYNVYPRFSKVESILSGGVTPTDGETVTVDGESYTEADTGMSLEEMRRVFSECFCEREDIPEEMYLPSRTVFVREEYTEKYIDAVYIEEDGKLYRRDSAPAWTLGNLGFDPYYGIVDGDGETVILDVIASSDFYHGAEECDFLYICSELPIKVLE